MGAIDRTARFMASATLAVFVMTGVGMSAASAQPPAVPIAAAFLANPGQLLQQNPDGGVLLASSVQQLVLADPSTFKVVLGLLTNANDGQKAAIGQGLAQATKIEALTNQTLAVDWQQQIAAINDQAFKTAALDAFGDVQLGAVGGAPGGAASAGLGGPGGGTPLSSGPSPRTALSASPSPTTTPSSARSGHTATHFFTLSARTWGSTGLLRASVAASVSPY